LCVAIAKYQSGNRFVELAPSTGHRKPAVFICRSDAARTLREFAAQVIDARDAGPIWLSDPAAGSA
jgi:hypothetical protein